MTAAVKHMDNLTKKQHELNLAKKRKVKALQKEPCSVEGASVFFEGGCNTFAPGQLRNRSVVECDGRWQAHVFVVKVPEQASPEIQLMARITGARITTEAYLESSGERGACISFEPAMHTKRSIYVTSGFMELNLNAASDLYNSLQLVDCKWTLVGSLDEVNKILGNGANRKNRQREVLVFLTEAEKDDEDCS